MYCGASRLPLGSGDLSYSSPVDRSDQRLDEIIHERYDLTDKELELVEAAVADN